MLLNAVHGSGSLGTNVLGTGAGCLLCCAGIGPDINRIATEIRIALMLRLLETDDGIAGVVDPSTRISSGIIAPLKPGRADGSCEQNGPQLVGSS
jgi:hypothetical protein